MLGTFAWLRSRESGYHLYPTFWPGAQPRRATLIASADDATSYDNCTAGLVRIGRWFPSRSTEFVQADRCRPIPGQLRRDEESKRNCASFGHPVSKAAMALDQDGQNLRASNSRFPTSEHPDSKFPSHPIHLLTLPTYYLLSCYHHQSPLLQSLVISSLALRASPVKSQVIQVLIRNYQLAMVTQDAEAKAAYDLFNMQVRNITKISQALTSVKKDFESEKNELKKAG